MPQSTPFHDSGVIGIANFSLGGTLISSAQLLGSVSGEYTLVVFNSENKYEMIDPEKFIELADNVRRLLLEYNPDRLLQLASENVVQSLDEVYADVDKEAEKYRALLEALVDQSQDQNDLPE